MTVHAVVTTQKVSVCVGGSVCVCMGWRAQCAPVTVQAGVTTRKVSVCVGGSVCVYVWGGEHSVRL